MTIINIAIDNIPKVATDMHQYLSTGTNILLVIANFILVGYTIYSSKKSSDENILNNKKQDERNENLIQVQKEQTELKRKSILSKPRQRFLKESLGKIDNLRTEVGNLVRVTNIDKFLSLFNKKIAMQLYGNFLNCFDFIIEKELTKENINEFIKLLKDSFRFQLYEIEPKLKEVRDLEEKRRNFHLHIKTIEEGNNLNKEIEDKTKELNNMYINVANNLFGCEKFLSQSFPNWKEVYPDKSADQIFLHPQNIMIYSHSLISEKSIKSVSLNPDGIKLQINKLQKLLQDLNLCYYIILNMQGEFYKMLRSIVEENTEAYYLDEITKFQLSILNENDSKGEQFRAGFFTGDIKTRSLEEILPEKLELIQKGFKAMRIIFAKENYTPYILKELYEIRNDFENCILEQISI